MLQMTDGWATAYSEHEHKYTFAKNRCTKIYKAERKRENCLYV